MKKLVIFLISIIIIVSAISSKTSAAISKSGIFPYQPPIAEKFLQITSTTITPSWGFGTNDASCKYECTNETTGQSMPPKSSTESWLCDNLLPDNDYSFSVRAWDDNLTPPSVTSWTNLGTARTTQRIKIQGIDANNGQYISSFPDITFSFKYISQLKPDSIRVIINGADVKDGSSSSSKYDNLILNSGYATITYTPKSALPYSNVNITVEAQDINGTIYTESVNNLITQSSPNQTLKITSLPLCYPNPFNPSSNVLKISYYLSADGEINIYILDSSGKVIFKDILISGTNGARYGYNEYLWNGKDAFGHLVDNDVYLVCITNNNGNILGKTRVVVLK